MTDARIAFNEALGRRVRLGSWSDQKVSTYRAIREALEAGDFDEAAELGNYFIDEADVCYSLYRQWIADLHRFLGDRGASSDELAEITVRITAVLRLPDGSPWNARRQWDRFLSNVETFVRHCHRYERAEALVAVDTMKETWRRTHDRDVDHITGLMSEVVRRHGEGALTDMYDQVLAPLFAWRYAKFDVDSMPWDDALETLMLVACEAMRGHLCGPERTGDFELVELADRYVLRFDPCGSGQRTLRGDVVEGTPPRDQPPYEWPVSTEAHSWNHFTPGVCLYCAHCIVVMEEMAIDHLGYPIRAVDPPISPDADGTQKCSWTMFKDPTAVPEEYYARVGRARPRDFGSKAHGFRPLPVVSGMPGEG